MIRALYSAASGMTAQQMNVDNIAHNLANANTTGFKSRRAQFQDLSTRPGATGCRCHATDIGANRFAARSRRTRCVERNHLFARQLFPNEQSLDLVIQGHGFFQIRRPSGELAYTRDGAFHVDRDGNMVTLDGDPLEPQSRSRGSTGRDDRDRWHGQLHDAWNTGTQQAGQIQIADFQNPSGLDSMGHNLYRPTTASGDAVVGTPGGQEGLGSLMQGYLEQSNVSVVEELSILSSAKELTRLTRKL